MRPGDDWTVPVTELDPRTGGRHRDVFSHKNRDEQEQGWPAFLDQLAKLLARL